MIGVYENGLKFDEIVTTEHTSEALICALEQLSKEYEISRIVYANTPGSFMGLKVAYVVLKSFCIVKDCGFACVSGFELNGGGAIRANKSLSFIREDDKISLAKVQPVPFVLPDSLCGLKLSADTLPEYILQAV